MGKAAVNDLADQYRRALRMLYDEVGRFDDTQWVTGLSSFQIPVKLAMHILDCLDYYFSGVAPTEYVWGHRFGGGWWELSDEQLPDKAALIAYAREIEDRIVVELTSLSDEDLSEPFEIDVSAQTLLGHYVYALRHTMHHHGSLATLAVHHGVEGGSWA